MNTIRAVCLVAAGACLPLPAAAQEAPGKPQIDYAGFVELAGKLESHREQRRIGWDEFAALAGADGAILLDARS
jgi:hypothetical protein